MNNIINLCKNRGFVFPGSEIYGGLANTWDYGPLGVELKNNIKREWWRCFVQQNDNSVGIDGGILLNPKVWVASGHVSSFSDPLMDCKACKTRHRADKLIEAASKGKVNPDNKPNEWLEKWITENGVKCPNCGKMDWTGIRQFNLMFKTHRGVVEGATDDAIYLRPETAQNQFVDFLNVQRSMRLRVPFGIGQIGKAFRNEITPGNFIFRVIEFEQMEHQFFCREKESVHAYKEYKEKAIEFYVTRLGLNKKKLRFKDHENLCHYAKMACDMEYEFPFGFSEIGGTHHRGTWDLSQHEKNSGKSMEYTDPVTGEKFIPTVIESSHGCDRLLLACICDAYEEQKLDKDDTRVVLHFHPRIAPYKVAVLPLQKKEQGESAFKIYRDLCKSFMCTYDESGSIGKRYRRADEVGTPFCVTVDFDTEKDGAVTVRERDSMKQERVKITDLVGWVNAKIQ